MLDAGARRARLGYRRAPRDWRLDVGAAALVVIAVLLGLTALREARLIAIPTVLACLIALAASPVARKIERRGAPSGLSAFIIVFGGLAFVSGAAYALAPSADALWRNAPTMVEKITDFLREVEDEVAATAATAAPATESGEGEQIVDKGRTALIGTLASAPAMLGALIYGVFLTFFLIADRARVSRFILSSSRSFPSRLRVARVILDIKQNVATYLFSITVINLALGACTAAVFWLIGVPNALLWGAAMAVLNYIPFLGAVIVNLAVAAVGVVTFDPPETALLACAALATLNTIEGYMITPRLVGQHLRMSALAVFFAVAFGAWLWGAAGALLATPALIVIRAMFMRTA